LTAGCRYVERYGNALVHAIDGDYLAIALLYYAKHGLTPENKIFIYRHLSTLAPTGRGKEKRGGAVKKKKATESDSKCWVDMQMLYRVLVNTAWGNCSVRGPFTDGDAVRSLVFLMLAAGTDFSRGLPLLGPKRMWAALHKVAQPLIQSVQGGAVLDEQLFADGVVAKLYAAIFERHLKGLAKPKKGRLDAVLEHLQGSSLSPLTKERLPSLEKVQTTVRNLGWVMEYWGAENCCVETPLFGENGFSQAPDGGICFSDLLPPGS
jgi:hypothetical protein